MKYFIAFFFLITSSLCLAQHTTLPKDFKLVYRHDAGMYPLRETLTVDAQKGTYDAFEKGRRFKSRIRKKGVIEQLHQQLDSSGFYQLSLVLREDKPRQIVKDEGKMSLSVTANGKSYIVTRKDLEEMKDEEASIVNSVFDILGKMCQQYRDK